MARFEAQIFQASTQPVDVLLANTESIPRVVELYAGIKSVELSGVFDGASITIQGKILADWTPLAIGLAAAGIYTFDQPLALMRVVVVGGGASTDLRATLAGYNARSI